MGAGGHTRQPVPGLGVPTHRSPWTSRPSLMGAQKEVARGFGLLRCLRFASLTGGETEAWQEGWKIWTWERDLGEVGLRGGMGGGMRGRVLGDRVPASHAEHEYGHVQTHVHASTCMFTHTCACTRVGVHTHADASHMSTHMQRCTHRHVMCSNIQSHCAQKHTCICVNTQGTPEGIHAHTRMLTRYADALHTEMHT